MKKPKGMGPTMKRPKGMTMKKVPKRMPKMKGY